MVDKINFFAITQLRTAWLAVKRKKARGGIDGVTIEEFDRNIERNLTELHAELEVNTYIPEPYERIYYQSPGSNVRPLGLPTIKDKVVQMAVRNVLEEIFNPIFKYCSYAYRPGLGHRKAIRRVDHYLGTGNVWVTTCDIDKFFDSLNHEIMLSLIKDKIKDERILRLLTLWLKIGIVHREEYRDVDKGVPQGGIISPLLSNIYLHPFDCHLTKLGFNLIRYADDFVSLEDSRPRAAEAHDAAESYLNIELKLSLNPVEKKVWNVAGGFVFLGLQFCGKRKTIAAKKFNKARIKIREICREGNRQSLGKVVERLNESIRSWRYYYGDGNTKKQFAALEKHIQIVLSKQIKKKLQTQEIKSAAEAEKTLRRLDFLLIKKDRERAKYIREILKGEFKHGGKTPAQGTGKSRQKSGQTKQTRQRPPQSPAIKPEARENKALTPAAIKQQIGRKKKRYQRRHASSSELIVTRVGCQIGKFHQQVVVRQGGKILQKTAIIQLKYIVIIAEGVSLSSNVIRLCANAKIPIDFINIQGQPFARLSHPDYPRVKVGLAQIQAFENDKAVTMAKTFVDAKIRNQLNLMKYFHKYHKNIDASFSRIFAEEEQRIEQYLGELEALADNLTLGETRGKLLAIEGRAGSSYWRMVRELVKDEVEFKRRERQGASDLFNCLLNYGYGILYSRIWGGVLRAGLNPAISFLHTDQPGKGTLVFDLIEEFRPQAVDRVIISMIGRGERLTMGKTFLDSPTRNKLLKNILERLNMPFKFRDREKTLMEVINHQANALAKYLQGQNSHYWPFIGKW